MASLISTTVSATLGVSSLIASGFADPQDFRYVWSTWWIGDVVGDLVVAPLLILWWRSPRPGWEPRQFFEVLILFSSLCVVSLFVFGGWLPPEFRNWPLEFLGVPFLLWAAFRFGPREAATAAALLSTITILGTLQGFGPFVRQSPNESLVLLQCFTGFIVMLALYLAAVVSEHKRAQSVNAQLAAIVDSSEDAIVGVTLEGIVSSWNPGAVTMFGYVPEEILGKPLRVLLSSGHSDASMVESLAKTRLKEKVQLREAVQFQMRFCDINRLLLDRVAELKPLAKSRGLEIRCDLSKDLPPVPCAPEKISQVVANLISNAIKFSTHGKVTIQSTMFGTYVRISVRDQGWGIKEQDRPKLFQSFVQLVHPASERGEGSGLGLAICKRIIERHSGRIDVESVFGEGSTFYFDLPLSEMPLPSWHFSQNQRFTSSPS